MGNSRNAPILAFLRFVRGLYYPHNPHTFFLYTNKRDIINKILFSIINNHFVINHMKAIKTLIKIIPAFAFLPLLASAQGLGNFSGITSILNSFITIINSVLAPLVFALAFLMFLWGMFTTFILGGTDEGKQTEGKQLMLYSILAFVVMVSIWGIVNLVTSGFGLSTTVPAIPPTPGS